MSESYRIQKNQVETMAEGPYKLPEDWRWVRLREVCLPTERRDPSKDPLTPFMYIDISSVDNINGEINSFKNLLGKEAPSRARKVIKTDDILFATTRPYLKNIAMVNPVFDGQICSTGFCVLRPNSNIAEPMYVFYVCRSDHVVSQLSGMNMRGASYPAVTDEDVFGVSIPLPPIEEQRRIVARIEALMERIREARRLRQEAREDAERLWQATLANVFPRPGTDLPSGWRWVRLREVFVLRNGKFIRKSRLGNSGDIQVYGSNGLIGYTRGVEPIIHTNAIVIGRVGACGAVNVALAPAWVSDNAMYVCEWLTDCDLSYIALALQHSNLGAFLKQGAQPSISQSEVYQRFIPLPPLEEQRRIVAYLEAVREKVKTLKEGQVQTEAELQRLEQSILDSAFRGKL